MQQRVTTDSVKERCSSFLPSLSGELLLRIGQLGITMARDVMTLTSHTAWHTKTMLGASRTSTSGTAMQPSRGLHNNNDNQEA